MTQWWGIQANRPAFVSATGVVLLGRSGTSNLKSPVKRLRRDGATWRKRAIRVCTLHSSCLYLCFMALLDVTCTYLSVLYLRPWRNVAKTLSWAKMYAFLFINLLSQNYVCHNNKMLTLKSSCPQGYPVKTQVIPYRRLPLDTPPQRCFLHQTLPHH